MAKATKYKPSKAARRLEKEVAKLKERYDKQAAPPEAGKDIPNIADAFKGAETKRLQITCGQCWEPFESDALEFATGEKIAPTICERCRAEFNSQSELLEQQKTLAERTERHTKDWPRICPPIYRDPRGINLKPEIVKKIMARDLAARGLGIVGTPRIGKTTLIFQLLAKYHLAGKRIVYTYAPDFSDTIAAMFSRSANEADQFIRKCCAVDVWFYDDLGKGIMTERALSSLLRVIEHRTNSELPVFFTGNKTGAELIKRLTNERGDVSDFAEPIIERLRNFCDTEKV